MTTQPEWTNSWAVPYHGLWRKHLGKFVGVEAHALEIGSYEGRSSCFFVGNILTHENSTLDCVDPWLVPGTEERFQHNIDALGCRAKMHIHKGASDTLPLDGKEWSFVYVDGWHSAKAALFDAVRAWVSLKKGGVLIWDDYQWCINEKKRVDCPKMAIDAFLNVCENELKVLHIGGQVIVEKK